MRTGRGSAADRGTRRAAVLAAATALFASASADAVNLIFDSSPAPIGTAQVADTSFWVGVNLPGVIASIVGPGGGVTVNAGGNSAALGINAGSTGNSLTVTGAGAALTVAESIYVGNGGASNALAIESGAVASCGSFYMGALATSNGNTFDLRTQATLTTSGDVGFGLVGGAATNVATVAGTGTTWTVNGNAYIGNASVGNTLTISGGGKVLANTLDVLIGATPGADSNRVTVTGGGSELSNLSALPLHTLYVGRSGNSNTLEILAGGKVTSGNVRIGGGSGATGSPFGNGATVDGGGSTWTIAGTLRVGAGVAGTNSRLDVTGGGVVTVTGNSFVGYDAVNDDNSVLVSGSGSQLNVQALTIGRVSGAANNFVTLANGGTLSAASITLGAAGGTGVGGLVIGAGGAAGSIAPATTISGVGTDPIVRFNHTDALHSFASSLTGTLAVVHDGTGATDLAGATKSYTGATTVNAGELRIGGVGATGAVVVNAGATLGLPAGAPAATSGGYVQAAGATLRVYVADAGTYGTLAVAGNASLPAAAAIGVSVADCGAIAPGSVIAGVVTSANPIVASGFTVTDNCAKLAFIAVVRANGQAIDLIVVNDASVPIPTITDFSRALLALALALAALAAIHRRSAASRACRVPRPRS